MKKNISVLFIGLLLVSLFTVSLSTASATEYNYSLNSIQAIAYNHSTTKIGHYDSIYWDSLSSYENHYPGKVYYYDSYGFNYYNPPKITYGDTIRVTLPAVDTDGGKIEYQSDFCEEYNDYIHLVNTTTQKIGNTPFNTYTYEVIHKGTPNNRDNKDYLIFTAYKTTGYDTVFGNLKVMKLNLKYWFVFDQS